MAGDISEKEFGEMVSTVKTTTEAVKKLERRIEAGQIETNRSLSNIHKRLDDFFTNAPCQIHAEKIKALEKRPSATKAIYIIGSAITIILGVYGLIHYM